MSAGRQTLAKSMKRAHSEASVPPPRHGTVRTALMSQSTVPLSGAHHPCYEVEPREPDLAYAEAAARDFASCRARQRQKTDDLGDITARELYGGDDHRWPHGDTKER